MTDEKIEWLTGRETAKHLGCTLRTLQNWQQRRLVPFFKIGRSVRYKLADVQAHLENRCKVEPR